MSRIKESLRSLRFSIAPAIALGLTGSVVTVVLPAILAESVRRSDLVNRLDAIEMLGATVATACLSPFLSRINRRRLATIACIAALIMDMISTQTNLVATLELVRCTAGLAEGIVLAVSVAYVASSRASERNLALFVATNLSTATIILKLLPGAVTLAGRDGPFSLLAGLAGLSLVAAVAIPNRAKRSVDPFLALTTSRIPTRSRASRLGVAIGLLALIVLPAGAGGVWPSLVRFASVMDVPVAAVTRILGDATLAGIAGALLAAWLGTISARRTTVVLGTATILSSVIALANVRHAVGFACSAMAFMASWMFLVPSYMSILAAADREGRAAAFSLATQYGGLALGASLGNVFTRGNETRPILAVGAILLSTAMAMALYADSVVTKEQSRSIFEPIRSKSESTDSDQTF